MFQSALRFLLNRSTFGSSMQVGYLNFRFWHIAWERSPSIQAIGDCRIQIAPVFMLHSHGSIGVFPGELVLVPAVQKDAFLGFFQDKGITPAILLEQSFREPDSPGIADGDQPDISGASYFPHCQEFP